MGTIVEKILSRKAGKDVRAGEIITAEVDAILTNDAAGPLAIDYFRKMGAGKVVHPERIAAIVDHYVPCPNSRVAGLHQMLYDFCSDNGIRLSTSGIAHQVFDELGYVIPGRLIIGSDSHTTTHGYAGCIAIGVGASDTASAMIDGELWLKVPETILVEFKGSLRSGVYGKDVALYLLSVLGAAGGNYKAIEFTGEGLSSLSIADRKTICNLAAECSAKCAVFPVDSIAEEYISSRGLSAGEAVYPDKDASYLEKLTIDLGSIPPMISKPARADIAVPVSECAGLRIDMAVIGTCTNGRIEDFMEVDRILCETEEPFRSETLVIPASQAVLSEMMERGYAQRLVAKGAMLLPPGCGPCCGSSPGTPRDGMNVISTANRNFIGRMGNVRSDIYLASPVTVARAALKGRIPRED